MAHDGEALRIRLHHSVLNTVVHHFDKVSGARRTRASPTFVLARCECLKNGPQPRHNILVAADHHAVTFLQSPNAPRRSYVHEVEAFLLERRITTLRVFIV